MEFALTGYRDSGKGIARRSARKLTRATGQVPLVVENLEERRLLAYGKIEIAFVADTTGSTISDLYGVKLIAQQLIERIDPQISDWSRNYGVASYRDFDGPGVLTTPYVFQVERDLRPGLYAAEAAIDTWTSDDGGDLEEADLYALTHSANDMTWHDGYLHFLVWLGDAPGHDPSGPATDTTGADTATLDSTIAALQAQDIHVLAIGISGDYLDMTGQATAIAEATDGMYVSEAMTSKAGLTDAAYDKIMTMVDLASAPDAHPKADYVALSGMPWADVNVVKNDNVLGGRGLSVVDFSQPAHGTLFRNYDGTLRYTPEEGYTGWDGFAYTMVNQYGMTASSSAYIQVGVPVDETIWIEGTEGNDTITVNASGDTYEVWVNSDRQVYSRLGAVSITVVGLEGNDKITIGTGVIGCIIDGGTGDDSIVGGDGNDEIRGDAGNDTIVGGQGDDTLAGNTGRDSLSGGDGTDLIQGGLDEDTISGGLGNDMLYGGNGQDIIFGDAGNDQIYGKGKGDTLFGGDGNDLLCGGAGDDWIYGDTGDDYIDAVDDAVFADRINGGPGSDNFVADGQDQALAMEPEDYPLGVEVSLLA